MKDHIYIYIIFICIIIILGIRVAEYRSTNEGFTLTFTEVVNWTTGENILMPLFLDLLVFEAHLYYYSILSFSTGISL